MSDTVCTICQQPLQFEGARIHPGCRCSSSSSTGHSHLRCLISLLRAGGNRCPACSTPFPHELLALVTTSSPQSLSPTPTVQTQRSFTDDKQSPIESPVATGEIEKQVDAHDPKATTRILRAIRSKKNMTKVSRRLLREVEEARAYGAHSNEPWLSVNYDESSRQAVVTFQGPPDSHYSHGVFRIIMSFRDTHPFVPPQVKFTHQVFHPNVSLDGQTIDSTLLTSLWSHSLSLLTIVCHIRDMLSFTDLLRSCPISNAPTSSTVTGEGRKVEIVFGKATSVIAKHVEAGGDEAWAVGTECAGLWLLNSDLAKQVTHSHTSSNANHSLTFS
jgi:ubiquitin-protein ligase